jgi:hypothetical protein
MVKPTIIIGKEKMIVERFMDMKKIPLNELQTPKQDDFLYHSVT